MFDEMRQAGLTDPICRQTFGSVRLTLSGSARLVRALLRDGLIGELRVLVHPILVGHGGRLFEDDTTHALELVNEATLSNGVLNLTYTPAAS